MALRFYLMIFYSACLSLYFVWYYCAFSILLLNFIVLVIYYLIVWLIFSAKFWIFYICLRECCSIFYSSYLNLRSSLSLSFLVLYFSSCRYFIILYSRYNVYCFYLLSFLYLFTLLVYSFSDLILLSSLSRLIIFFSSPKAWKLSFLKCPSSCIYLCWLCSLTEAWLFDRLIMLVLDFEMDKMSSVLIWRIFYK